MKTSKKYMRLLSDLNDLLDDLMNEITDLNCKLDEQTDKHWEGNRQIALYSDELRNHETVRATECERHHRKCLGCPFDGVVCNEWL